MGGRVPWREKNGHTLYPQYPDTSAEMTSSLEKTKRNHKETQNQKEKKKQMRAVQQRSRHVYSAATKVGMKAMMPAHPLVAKIGSVQQTWGRSRLRLHEAMVFRSRLRLRLHYFPEALASASASAS